MQLDFRTKFSLILPLDKIFIVKKLNILIERFFISQYYFYLVFFLKQVQREKAPPKKMATFRIQAIKTRIDDQKVAEEKQRKLK